MSETSSGKGGCLWPLLVFAALGFFIYNNHVSDSPLDEEGWVSHTEDSIITAQPGWLAGETKECFSIPILDPKAVGLVDKDVGYALSHISCDEGPEHHIKIQFFGRENQPEHRGIVWSCKKNADSL